MELRKSAVAVELEANAKLQAFCTRVANELPIAGWHAHGEGLKPWGCILTAKHEWCCDSCPAKDICPYDAKEWSK